VIRENCRRRSAPKLLSGAQAPRLIKAAVPARRDLITHCSLSAALNTDQYWNYWSIL